MNVKTLVSALTIGILFTSNSFAEKNNKISLKYNFSRFGQSICNDTKIVKINDLNLLCEGMSEANRIFLRVSVKKTDKVAVLISANVEEIDSTGVVTVISNFSLQTLIGVQGEISESDGSEDSLKFGAIPNFEN